MQTIHSKPGGIRRGRVLVALLLVSALVTIGGIGVHHFAVGQDSPAISESKAIYNANALSTAFRDAAKVMLPTVVTVKSTTKARRVRSSSNGQANPFKGTPWEGLFDERFKDGNNGDGFIPPRGGMGSGVIIDSKGIILTNNHVVEGADKVTVELSDGTVLEATDIQTDPRTDVAVVHVKPEHSLPAARLGNSDSLEVGDWVLAIGNPFELSHTVSAGIISGKGRSLGLVERGTFLQTDAAINPGNSGGPLINLKGEVIGINTAIASRSGGYQGIGFAIPINTAKRISKQLITNGKVQRAYLGVAIAPIDADVAKKLGVEPHGGVLIAEVRPDTPAAAANLKAMDVILKFAGKRVTAPGQLQQIVEASELDSTQKMTIVRDGKQLDVPVVVQALPSDFGRQVSRKSENAEPRTPEEGYADTIGLGVSELTSEVAKRLGYDNSTTGVLISNVDRAGVAFENGIREGMVILKIGQNDVNSVEEFEKAMEHETLKEGILILIETPRGNRFMVLKG